MIKYQGQILLGLKALQWRKAGSLLESRQVKWPRSRILMKPLPVSGDEGYMNIYSIKGTILEISAILFSRSLITKQINQQINVKYIVTR